MASMNNDQLHRDTLGIYSTLMDQFNPSLQKLVSLGNSYIQAFHVLSTTSEAYFNALCKIGEQAMYRTSSPSIGHVLVQISENQRRLNAEAEGVFTWFHAEVLQEMDQNIQLDKDFIADSRRRYEMEVRSQATALERQTRRGESQCLQFLLQSHSEALQEEERRYRFLAEKHCDLTQALVQLMTKTGGVFQQRAKVWREELNATRGPQGTSGAARLDHTSGAREDNRSLYREEQPLGRVPSRAPSPQPGLSRSSSVTQLTTDGGPLVGGGGGGGGRRAVRALVAHQPDPSSPTMLSFPPGERIVVMVSQPRNGWLYGQAESSSRQGWFPASFVKSDDFPKPASFSFSGSTLRSSSSMSDLLDQSGGGGSPGSSPDPPPPPSLPSSQLSGTRTITHASHHQQESISGSKRPQQHGSRPELFPKGTNPFATVKLRPTYTNDKSMPRVHQ